MGENEPKSGCGGGDAEGTGEPAGGDAGTGPPGSPHAGGPQ